MERMENEEKVSREQILNTILILRNVTLFVKVVPFVYAFLYILCMVVYMFCSDETATIVDMLFYVSPLTCLLFFGLSYTLKFCNWYRLQCCLPMFPLPFTLIDEFVYMFEETAVAVNLSIIVTIFTISLINTYFVFLRK